MILVSSLSHNQIGISQGFVKSISADRTRFTLLLDKNLNEISLFSIADSSNSAKLTLAKTLFRLDKVNFRSAITLNYTNLARLMKNDKVEAKKAHRQVEEETNGPYKRLRSFIIEKKLPEFNPTLPKDYIIKNKVIKQFLKQNLVFHLLLFLIENIVYSQETQQKSTSSRY